MKVIQGHGTPMFVSILLSILHFVSSQWILFVDSYNIEHNLGPPERSVAL